MESKWRRKRERGRKQNENKQRTLKNVTSWMTCRWSECARCDTLSHNVMCAKGERVREKLSCEVYLSTLFSLLLSCLVSLSPCFYLALSECCCVSLLLWCVVVCVVFVVCSVWCDTLEKPRVSCPKRPRVCRHHAHTSKHVHTGGGEGGGLLFFIGRTSVFLKTFMSTLTGR